MEDEKVRIPLKKVPLQSEREEIRHKRNRKALVSLLCVMLLVTGVLLGFGISKLLNNPYVQSFSNDKLSSIETYLNTYWLYRNDYDDLKTELEDKAYDGMLSFEDDPYTSYMSSEEYSDFVSSIDKNYVGIGTIVSDNVGAQDVVKEYSERCVFHGKIELVHLLESIIVDKSQLHQYNNRICELPWTFDMMTHTKEMINKLY